MTNVDEVMADLNKIEISFEKFSIKKTMKKFHAVMKKHKIEQHKIESYHEDGTPKSRVTNSEWHLYLTYLLNMIESKITLDILIYDIIGDTTNKQ